MSEHSSDDDQSDNSFIYKNNRNTLETIAKNEADELALQFETVKKFLNYFLEASIHSEVVLNCISVLSFWEGLVQRAQEGDWSIRGCEDSLDKRFGPIVNGTPLEKCVSPYRLRLPPLFNTFPALQYGTGASLTILSPHSPRRLSNSLIINHLRLNLPAPTLGHSFKTNIRTFCVYVQRIE